MAHQHSCGGQQKAVEAALLKTDELMPSVGQSARYTSCTAKDRKALQRVIKRAQKIIYCPMPSLNDIVDSRGFKKGKEDLASSTPPWQQPLQPSALGLDIQGPEEPHKWTIFIPGQQGS